MTAAVPGPVVAIVAIVAVVAVTVVTIAVVAVAAVVARSGRARAEQTGGAYSGRRRGFQEFAP